MSKKKPPNLAPQNYETNISETNKKAYKTQKTSKLELGEAVLELTIPG